MRRAIGSPTRVQQAYHDSARALGCVVCLVRIRLGLQRAVVCGPTDIHHRNLHDLHGQKQLGHDSVVALGSWHHDGVLLPRTTTRGMTEAFGPSFKFARPFREMTEELLPHLTGRGTERWQAFQDEELRRRHGRAA